MLLTGTVAALLLFSPTDFININLYVPRLGVMINQIGTSIPNYNMVMVAVSSNRYSLPSCEVFALRIGLLTLA